MTCPPEMTLQKYLLGTAFEDEAEKLSQHLVECPHCLETLDSLHASDTVLDAVRAARNSTISVAKVNESLIGKLCQLTQSIGGVRDSNTTQLLDMAYFLAPPQAADELGRLGPYRVLKMLGTGGMGVVFEAEDQQLKRRVALKVMKFALTASESARKRFLREAQLAASIEHDHIVAVYQVGEESGIPYLAMPLLRGEPLSERLLREKRLPLSEALRIGREIAEGLAAAHQHQLVHRDIKPANIWLETRSAGGPPATVTDHQRPTVSGSGESPKARVKILDFGLARAVDDESHLTQSGAITGTPSFMAPEQAQGEAVDHRCDLFSLGCVLYQMLTGSVAFQGSNTTATLLALTQQTPKPIRDLNPDVPEAVAGFVSRLLEKDPARRPQSAAEVAESLARLEWGEAVNRQTRANSDLPTEPEVSRLPRQRQSRTDVTTPLWRRRLVRLLLLGLGGFSAIVFGAVVLFVRTNRGTLRVELNDPRIEVSVNGTDIVVKDKTEEILRLEPGDHSLHVKQGDLQFDTDAISLKKGETVAVKIELVDGDLLAMRGDSPLGHRKLADSDRRTAATEPIEWEDDEEPAGITPSPAISEPFVILRDGVETARYKTIEEAIAASQPKDVIEVWGKGPFSIGSVKGAIHQDKNLIVRAKSGQRPLLVPIPSAAAKPDPRFIFHRGTIRFEGIDFASPAPACFVSGQDAKLIFQRCRMVRTTPGKGHLIKTTGGSLMLRDCLLISDSKEGAIGVFAKDGQNTTLEMNHSILIGRGLSLLVHGYDHTLRMTNCTLSGHSVISLQGDIPENQVRAQMTVSKCLILSHPISSYVARLSEFRWQGKDNVYGLSLTGHSGLLLPDQDQRTFEEWVNSPDSPESNSKLVETTAKTLSEFIDVVPVMQHRRLHHYLQELRLLYPDVGADPVIVNRFLGGKQRNKSGE